MHAWHSCARGRILLFGFVFAFIFAAATRVAQAQSITEFTIPSANSNSQAIAAGPDGALWFTELGTGKIGRVTTSGMFSEFTVPTATPGLGGIAAGPDGNLWFTEADSGAKKIGRITPAGTVTEFPGPSDRPFAITWGPDNALWFTEFFSSKIGRVTTAGVFTEFTVPTANSSLQNIVAGPDGSLWFTEGADAANKIGRITTAGTFTEFNIPTANSFANGIAAGPDGSLWFVEENGLKIGRVTTAGAFTEFGLPSGFAATRNIAAGADGAMWFTDGSGKIGRVTMSGVFSQVASPTTNNGAFAITSGADGNIWFTAANNGKIGKLAPVAPSGTSPLVASVLPTSRSVQVGSVATVFATIINTGNSALNFCRITTDTFVNGFFSYQTTNPSTNALNGSPNTGVTIQAGGLQSYVIAFKAGAPFAPTDVKLSYRCEGTPAAAPITGVNTLQLVFDASPVADMIAVGVTPSNDGFSHTGGNSGTGIFAIATTNIGPATSLTAKPRLSDSSLPLTATVCETNAQAQCKAPASASVTRSIAQNETPTFSVFLQASGAITADPAKNRVFLEFLDGGSVVRGSTSTAVTTQ